MTKIYEIEGRSGTTADTYLSRDLQQTGEPPLPEAVAHTEPVGKRNTTGTEPEPREQDLTLGEQFGGVMTDPEGEGSNEHTQ
ncbi:MAG: hypothetical protein NVS2B7_04520 [Herpetosiphon sp.]